MLPTALLLLTRAPGGDGPDLGKPGPYAVGQTDRSFTRTLPDGRLRFVSTHVWYPTQRDGSATPAQGAPGPAATGGPFPLIVFSHGYGGTPLASSLFLSHLASHGFVVAGPEHQDLCSQCDTAIRSANRPDDVINVVDNLLALNAGDDRVFAHLIDPDRIGVAGHSYGGWTTLAVLQRDRRFRAGLAINPATSVEPPRDPLAVSRPLMLMAGVVDEMVPYALTTRFFADIPSSAPDHYLLAVQRAGHQFGNQCIAGFATIGCEASMPQGQLQTIVNRIGTAFLLRYVAGRDVSDQQLGLQDTSQEYAVIRASADAAPPIPTVRPLQGAPPTPATAVGTVLLEDDLTVAQGGRLPTSSPDPARFSAGYVAGAYEIGINQHGNQGEALLPGSYADASIAVDAELLNPTPAQYVQLACRSQSPTSQYRFAFRPANGEYWIRRWPAMTEIDLPGLAGLARDLLPRPLYSTAVHQGSAPNHVELSCRGTTIAAAINGQTVASVSDNTFSAGQMWIAVGETPGTPGTTPGPTARFSHLVVTQQ
jgi:dienelactone hydrolase